MEIAQCCLRNPPKPEASERKSISNPETRASGSCGNPKNEILQFQPETKTLDLKTVDIPSPDNVDDVIIQVAYAGVCGTDLQIIEGNFAVSDKPLVMGHEISGTVFAIGSEVNHVQIGDNVAVDPNSACGLCKYCRTGSYHMCPDGVFRTPIGIVQDGGWAQYCKVPAKQIYRLPPKVSLKQGVLLEPLSCVAHAINRIYPLEVGSRILINGAGIAGTLMSCILHYLGHRNVIIVEPNCGRQDLIKRLFEGSPFQIVHPWSLNEAVGKQGIDICVDCSGIGKAIESGIELLNPGGKLCIYGIASPATKISVSPYQIFFKELSIFGTTINRYSYLYAINLLEAIGSTCTDYDKLGVKVFSLSQHIDALSELKQGIISKAVFELHPKD